jgi:hypothetical protein
MELMETVMVEAARESPLREPWRRTRREPPSSAGKSFVSKLPVPHAALAGAMNRDTVAGDAVAAYAMPSKTVEAAKAPAAQSTEAAKAMAADSVKTAAAKASADSMETAASAVEASASAMEASTAAEGSARSQRCRYGRHRRQQDRANRHANCFHGRLSR